MKRSGRYLARLTFFAFFLAFPLVAVGKAGQHADVEELPQPKLVEEQRGSDETRLFRPFYRASRYEVWQYYGVDRFGRFRPRVILSPHGAYYLYNGQPYPWVTTHEADFLPHVVD